MNIWMKRAVEIARKGFPAALPNPMVGCVVVKGGKKIAEGYHQRFGGPHAEVEALQRAGKRAKGADLYVTLEPCSHWGKTPPCTDAVIKAGIKRVFIAVRDPNPDVKGGGAKFLQRAGIKTYFTNDSDALALNLPFITTCLKKRPYIVLKAAVSLDGKIADYKGKSKWITDEDTRQYSRTLRGCFDAILVGVNTVLKDNPVLHSVTGRNPLRIVLDPTLRTPINSKITSTKEALTAIVIRLGVPIQKIIRFENKDVEILELKPEAGQKDLSLKHLFELLSLKGCQSILIEGGADTHARFIEQGLVDEVLWFIAPKILGGKNSLSAVGGRGLSINRAMTFTKITSERVGETILVRGSKRKDGLFWSILS